MYTFRHPKLLAGLLAVLALFPRPAVSDIQLPVEFMQSDTEERELYRSAGRLFEAGNYAAAAKSYGDFLDRFARHPYAPDARMMLAESLFRQALRESEADKPASERAYREARAQFERALKAIPPTDNLAVAAAFRVAEIDFNQKRYAAAIEGMARIQAGRPGGLLTGEARLLQAQALLATGQPEEAHRLLRAGLADQPVYQEDPRTGLAYGIALFEVGSSSESLRHLDRVDAPLAGLYAARAQLRLGKPLLAIERLRRVLRADVQGTYTELAQYLLAEAFFTAKDYLSAQQAYEQFLRSYSRSPYRPGAAYKIGLCQFERQEYLAARGSFQSVLQIFPDNEFAELSLYMIGESLMKERRLKEANFAYADLANSYSTPLAGTGWFKRGWTHYKLEEFTAAENALRTMLSKHASHELAPAASMLIGNVLTRQGRYGEAVIAYQQALDTMDAAPLSAEKKEELREAALALSSRANLLAKDYGRLTSGHQYVMKHARPTLNPWKAATSVYIGDGYYRQGLYDQALALYREAAASFAAAPESALAVDGAAWALFAKGEYAQAEAERQKLAQYRARPPVAPAKTVLLDGKLDPELFLVNEFETATARFNRKKYVEALDAYELFAKSHPGHPLAAEAQLQAGWCYYRLEHYGQALKVWESLEASQRGAPLAAKAAWATADTYFRAARYDKAIESYVRILQSYPDDPAAGHARLRIAQSHYNAKNVVKAINSFEGLITLAAETPEAAQAMEFLTQLLYRPDAKPKALAAMSRIAETRPNSSLAAKALYFVARDLYEAGKYEAAIPQLEVLIARLAGSAEIRDAEYFLAESYYQTKRYRDAALSYERFTQNYAGDKRFAEALFHMGSARFKVEEFSPAAEAFRRLATEFPETSFAPVALFNAALAYRKLGKWEDAAFALRTYLTKHPKAAKGSNAVGELTDIYEEHRQFGALAELLQEQRKGLKADGEVWLEYTHRLGEAYAASENEEKAAAEFREAVRSPLKKNSFRLAALAKLGDYYERKERWADAYDVYEDLARNATEADWTTAARARAQAAREKLGRASPPASKPAPPAKPPLKPSLAPKSPAPKPVAASKPAAAAKVAAKPAAKPPASKSAAAVKTPAPKPAAKPAPKPIAKPAPKSVPKPAPKPAAKAVPKKEGK